MSATTPSPATERAREFVAANLDYAVELGRRAGEDVHDPPALAATLRTGLAALADPEYLEGASVIVPGIGPFLGVRQPLLTAVGRGLRGSLRRDRPTTVLDVASRLQRESLAELRWLAID